MSKAATKAPSVVVKRGAGKSATVATESAKPRRTAPKSLSRKAAKPVLLAGGNPQIAKAYGDAPVQAYIDAMPGWKRDVGRRLDALIVRTVPGVHKAVKWNSPLYAVEGEGWFLGLHCLTKYVKVAFFRGTSLRPVPPGGSRTRETRYLDIHEDDQLDEAQLADWVKQSSLLPGERMWAGNRDGVRGVTPGGQPRVPSSNDQVTGSANKTMKKATTTMKSDPKEAKAAGTASELIDARIKELGDWRGETLARVRTLIKQAEPEVVEEWKWRGVPVWSRAGIICTGETYKAVVKMTFAKGASLEDPSGLFNSSLEGNTRRAIDIHQADEIDETALKALIRAAVALNISARAAAGPARSQKRRKGD